MSDHILRSSHRAAWHRTRKAAL